MFEHILSRETEEIAAAIVRVHESGECILGTAVPVPASVEDAMDVQGLVHERLKRPVAGWKVAIGPERRAIAAPLLDLHPAGCEIDLFSGCKIEIELAVLLARDLPRRAGSSYDRADLIEAAEHALLGVEIIGGRFDDASDVPFLSFLADNLGNSGYVVAHPLPLSVLSEPNKRRCRVTLGNAILHYGPAVHPAGDPLAPLLAYANAQNDRIGGLRAGQVVTTGSICGVLPIRSCGLLKVEVTGIGSLAFRFVERETASMRPIGTRK